MKRLLLAVAALGLAACSSTPDQPKPVELAPLVNVIGVRAAWSVPLAAPRPDFETAAVGKEFVAASRDGEIVRVDATSGKLIARFKSELPLTAAVGADEQSEAVVNTQNELLLYDRSGALKWKQRLPATVITAPVIAGGLVIVLSTDQTIQAFELADGSKRWASTRTPASLLLNRGGGMVVEGDMLYAGLAQGRMAALSVSSGTVKWEETVVSSRGANEIERLTDLVGKPAVKGSDACVRAFQTGITCVQLADGKSLWMKTADSDTPVTMDSRTVYATERNGKVLALNRSNGETLWTNDKFGYRGLSAPLALGRSVVFGDAFGLVHFLNRDDGALLARMKTDGTAITGQPVLSGSTLVVRSEGGLFAFVPE